MLEGTGTSTPAFIEAVFQADALAWGHVEEFFIVTEAGAPVAEGPGFTVNAHDYRPLRLGRLPVMAQTLWWSEVTQETFQTRYEQVWLDPSTFAPTPPGSSSASPSFPKSGGAA